MARPHPHGSPGTPRTQRNETFPHAIYDVMHGFIPLTEWEARIVDTPFYQRLRWIRQLGFASYIFPGADHNRFAHAMGVMQSMQKMLEALGLAVPDSVLRNPKIQSREAVLHRELRIAALLHDIGTFPFSHSIEFAYVRHGNDRRSGRGKAKPLPNSHEHLGSFIIKNTDYDNGITQILHRFGLDPTRISKIIKGESSVLIANQLAHSDLDADRMDYLLRDAHYTGLQYGQFDRDFILSNLVTFNAGKSGLGFAVKESAVHAVDDFLMARFSWYTQVVKNQDSAKFDIIASHVAEALLQRNLLFQFHDLLDMIERQDERFYFWNDRDFFTRCQQLKFSGKVGDKKLSEKIDMLLYRRPPKVILHPDFKHHMLQTPSAAADRKRLIHKIETRLKEIEHLFKMKGRGDEWILADIPDKDITFTKSREALALEHKQDVLYQERDPVKVLSRDGRVSLLVEHEGSLMSRLAQFVRFIPSVYANPAGYDVLASSKFFRHLKS